MPREIVQRDQDTKYVTSFDKVFLSTGCKIKKTCPRSPNLQAFVERVIQTRRWKKWNIFFQRPPPRPVWMLLKAM